MSKLNNQNHITVKEVDDGKRLDVYLAEELRVTRSQVQKMIGRGDVLVNGAPPKTGIKLSVGDAIRIIESSTNPYTLTPIPFPKILVETPDYLIVDKPAGLIVHAAPSKEQITLVDLLLEQYPELKGIGDDPLRPGIVHRLDKDASGIMVVARTQDSFDSLKRQFKLRRVHKEYSILVRGIVTPSEGRIDLPIARCASHSTRFVGNAAAGRQAITNYSVEKFVDGCSLVRVTPETGRTHQIRVHFMSRGYPLVGDTVYKKKANREKF